MIKAACFLFLLPAPVASFAPFCRTAKFGRIVDLAVSSGFQAQEPRKLRTSTFALVESNDGQSAEADAPAPSPSKIDNILKDLHDAALPFRIIVIGEGAILETTSVLGPHMASSVSKKTGERLVTLASDDRSFEFHLKVDKVGKVTFSEKDKPLENGGKKTMRICRFLSEEGGPICSLILADSSEDAADWFRGLTIRYGYEVLSD